jgi:hypothetical protein
MATQLDTEAGKGAYTLSLLRMAGSIDLVGCHHSTPDLIPG